MKKIILTFFALLPVLLSAQTFVVVDGYITSGTTGNAIDNFTVNIDFYNGFSATSTHSSVSTTNANGYYIDTLVVQNYQDGWTTSSFTDCSGSLLMDTAFSTLANPGTTINMVYCDSFANPGVGCNPMITTNVNGFSVVHTISNPIQTAGYSWNLPNGATATGNQVSYLLNTPGAFQACVTMTDPVIGCSGTACDSFWVNLTPPTNCDTNFTTSVGTNSVTHTITNPDTNTSYTWNLPNGNTASGNVISYPTSSLPTSGSNFNVCVTVEDTVANCIETGCGNFTYTAPQTNIITGAVFYNNVPVQNAVVYLIELDSNMNGLILTAVDSTTTQQGSYSFNNISNGSYYVKAALLSSDTNYLNYLPTYYDSNMANNVGELFWQNASPVSVFNNTVSVSIGLVGGNNPGGPGFIGGLVSQGANKTGGAGDPLQGVLVLLLDDNNDPVSFSISNSAGEFSFDDLALGIYNVYPEVTGINNNGLTVEINNENTDVNSVGVKVHSSYSETFFDPTLSTSEIQVSSLDIFPNPAREQVTISVGTEFATERNLRLEMMSMNGSVVLSETVLSTGISNLNIQDIPSGIYLVSVKSDQILKVSKLVVE